MKKSIGFLKYTLKMVLVKGEWFDLYGEESMSNILSSGNENNADKTLSFSVDLSGSSYPYKIWTKNGEDQTVYYGDWIDWKKLQ